MNNQDINIIELTKYIWTKKLSLIKWSVVGCITGTIIAISLPKEYICTAILAPESTKSNDANSMGGIASMMGLNISSTPNGINDDVYPIIIKSSPFINEFSKIPLNYNGNNITLYDYLIEHDKKPWWNYIKEVPSMLIALIHTPKSTSDTIDSFRPTGKQKQFENKLTSRINIVTEKKTSVIKLNVTMQNPEFSAIIADSLVIKLQRFMTRYFTAKTRSDLENNHKMLTQAKEIFYQIDNQYAIASDKNLHLKTQYSKIKIDRIKDEREVSYNVYKQLASQVEITRLKLQEITPVFTTIEPPRVPLNPSSPDKMRIILATIFLFIFFNTGVIIFKFITIK